MAEHLKIGTKKFLKQVDKEADRIKKELREVDRRTLNAVSDKGVKLVAKDIQQRTGLTQRAIKSAFKVKKATKRVLQVLWTITGRRLQYPGLRSIKKGGRQIGVSYLDHNKQRVKQTGSFDGHSGLFLIPGKYKDKRIAVFREDGSARKTTTFAGHSVPFLLRRDLKSWLRKRLIGMVKAERERQQKKVRYLNEKRGRR